MGRSHALAHRRLGSETVGRVNRSPVDLPGDLTSCPRLGSFEDGLALRLDLMVIATHPASHADLALRAMEAGAHVFVEKPLATTVADALRVVARARDAGRKLVAGHILRHHPSWRRLIEEARPGRSLRVLHEPQPAVFGPRLGSPQGAHALDFLPRGLRRPLRGRAVPDH